MNLSAFYLKFDRSSERRQAEASRIREKYPDRVPVRTSDCNQDSIYSSHSENTLPSNWHVVRCAGDCGKG